MFLKVETWDEERHWCELFTAFFFLQLILSNMICDSLLIFKTSLLPSFLTILCFTSNFPRQNDNCNGLKQLKLCSISLLTTNIKCWNCKNCQLKYNVKGKLSILNVLGVVWESYPFMIHVPLYKVNTRKCCYN